MLAHVIQIDLRQRVLMPPHDDGGLIAVEQEYILGVSAQDVFLAGNIERRPVAAADYKKHTKALPDLVQNRQMGLDRIPVAGDGRDGVVLFGSC